MRKLNGLGRTQIKMKSAVPNENMLVMNLKPEVPEFILLLLSFLLKEKTKPLFRENIFSLKKGSKVISTDICANV